MPNAEQAAPAADRAKETSLSALRKEITSIARSAVKLNEAIHNTGVKCIKHAFDFGDTTPARMLVDAMPKSHRRGILIRWFAEFSPISIANDTKTDRMKAHLSGKADANKGEEGYRNWDLEGAKATPFYAMPEAQADAPDVPTYEKLHDNIVQFVKRLEKKAEQIEDKDGKKKALAEIENLKKVVAA